MPEAEVSELISSVVQRGSALGPGAEPDEIRRRFTGARLPLRTRLPANSVVRRRVGVVLVAAVILAVFFVPLPHASLFRHLVAPAGRTPKPTVTTTPPEKVPSGQGIEEAWPTGENTIWAWTLDFGGGAAQGLERSTDGGRDWSDVTPSWLSKAVGDHYISDLFALDSREPGSPTAARAPNPARPSPPPPTAAGTGLCSALPRRAWARTHMDASCSS